MAEEDNLEEVLTKAFLEVDKAFARHLHFCPNGRFCHVIRLNKLYVIYRHFIYACNICKNVFTSLKHNLLRLWILTDF